MKMMSTDLTIIYEKGEDGYWIATIPEVPGAFSQGKTKPEARKNVLEAMQELMLARRDVAISERAKGSTFETVSMQA